MLQQIKIVARQVCVWLVFVKLKSAVQTFLIAAMEKLAMQVSVR
jgi:hypothetical protein